MQDLGRFPQWQSIRARRDSGTEDSRLQHFVGLVVGKKTADIMKNDARHEKRRAFSTLTRPVGCMRARIATENTFAMKLNDVKANSNK